MDGVTRIGVSLEPELLNEFDKIIQKKGYVSRSEAIRDLVRDSLSENAWKNDEEEVIGVMIVLIDLGVTNVLDKVEANYREHASVFSSVSSVPVDKDSKMDIVVASGKLVRLREFIADLTSIKGILRGKLVSITPGKCNIHQIGLRK
jgi:CopG family nickel-responsive transcriptional regulator